jgi:hypothetical protein
MEHYETPGNPKDVLDVHTLRENCIKMLLRCKSMYEARSTVRRIMMLIIKKEREVDVWLSNLDKLPDPDSLIKKKEQFEDLMRATVSSGDGAGMRKSKDFPKLRDGLNIMKRL